VSSGRGLWDGLITHPEESYLLWCDAVCDLETSWMRRPWRTGSCRAKNKQTNKLTPTCSRTLAESLPDHKLWERVACASALCGKGFLSISPLVLPMSVR